MNPFSGRLGWIWDKTQVGDVDYDGDRDIDDVIALAKFAGCDGVLLKSNDDNRRWFQASRATVEAFHSAGLRCLFWGYAYGDIEAFVLGAVSTVIDTGCDGYVVDGEAELRNSGNAGELARILKAALPGVPLGFAPLPIMRYHTGLDYPAWSELGYTLMPQIYSNVLGPQTYPAPAVIAEWRAAFPDADLAPVYGTYSALENGYDVKHPTAAMMAEFITAAEIYKCVGHSFYRLDTLDLSTLPTAEETMSPETVAAVRLQLNVLWGLAEKHRSKRAQAEQKAAITAIKNHLGIND